MQTILLYTKQNCHLCEEARDVLQTVNQTQPLHIETVDIAAPENGALAEIYGRRIPVLGRPGTTTELDWPFSAADVSVFLAS